MYCYSQQQQQLTINKALSSVTKTRVINDVCDAKFQLNLFRTFSFSVIDDEGHKQTFHICYTSLNICIVLVLYFKTVQFYSSKLNRSTKQYTSGNSLRNLNRAGVCHGPPYLSYMYLQPTQSPVYTSHTSPQYQC